MTRVVNGQWSLVNDPRREDLRSTGAARKRSSGSGAGVG